MPTESAMPEALRLWGYEGTEIEFGGDTLVLIGVDESSSCPAQVDDVALDSGVLDVTINTIGSDDCTSDAAHRSFIIQAEGTVDAVAINGDDVELLGS